MVDGEDNADDEPPFPKKRNASNNANDKRQQLWQSERMLWDSKRNSKLIKDRETHDRSIKPRLRKLERVSKPAPPVANLVLENPFVHHARTLSTLSPDEQRVRSQLFNVWNLQREVALAHTSNEDIQVPLVAVGGIDRFFTRTKRVNEREQVDRDYAYIYHKQLLEGVPVCNWQTKTQIEATKNMRAIKATEQPCSTCKQTNYGDTGDGASLSCRSCGTVNTNCIEAPLSYTEMQDYCANRKTAPYKRGTHFLERLQRVEGSEHKKIPFEVIEVSLVALAARHIDPVSNPGAVTAPIMRTVLKEAGYSAFFANIVKIINIITSRRCVEPFTNDEKTLLVLMFEQCQAPFDMFKRANGKNFLSYSYTLSKLCKMLGFDRFTPFLQPYVSPSNLQAAEHVWRQICLYNSRELQLGYWRFEPYA